MNKYMLLKPIFAKPMSHKEYAQEQLSLDWCGPDNEPGYFVKIGECEDWFPKDCFEEYFKVQK